MSSADVVITPLEQPGTSMLRLRTLIRLRWLAVVGQTIAVVFVNWVFKFPLPIAYCLALISLSAVLNIVLSLRWPPTLRLDAQFAGLLLGYDIVQLAGLLYLTGGLQNPFAFLFLVPVTVSATSLPLRWTMSLAGLAFMFATLLAFEHFPLPWAAENALQLPRTYVAGLWVALASGTVFSAIYARRIAVEARQMSTALAAAETVLAREQRFSALDGLAAAAAHELGTPLATIALVAKELKREIPETSPYTDDINLLISQTARCREILSRLANRDTVADEIFENVKVTAMIEDLVAPLRGSDVTIDIDAAAATPSLDTSEPVFRRNPAITYGLGNVLENAIDFAKSRVQVKARWSEQKVNITVTDDGPGFAEALFDRLGDPFVTTRPGYDSVDPDSPQHQGMGLGLFIAKTLLERSGATVNLSNRPIPEHGAEITLEWPRRMVDGARLSS